MLKTVTLRFEGLTPPPELLPNRRHRRGGYRPGIMAARKFRQDAARLALDAVNRHGLPLPCFHAHVRARVTVAWERRLSVGPKRARMQYRRHPDPDGLNAALKPLWDALQDVGIITNDRHLIHEPVEQINDPNGTGYIVVHLAEEPAKPCHQAPAPHCSCR